MPSILRAQTNYPEKPITVIVPFAAGGPTDAIARIYAEFLSRDLGQTLVIENVAGAGGTSGAGLHCSLGALVGTRASLDCAPRPRIAW